MSRFVPTSNEGSFNAFSVQGIFEKVQPLVPCKGYVFGPLSSAVDVVKDLTGLQRDGEGMIKSAQDTVSEWIRGPLKGSTPVLCPVDVIFGRDTPSPFTPAPTVPAVDDDAWEGTDLWVRLTDDMGRFFGFCEPQKTWRSQVIASAGSMAELGDILYPHESPTLDQIFVPPDDDWFDNVPNINSPAIGDAGCACGVCITPEAGGLCLPPGGDWFS